MTLNILTAAFPEGATSITTSPLYQWDYGQVINITGLDLPAAFEAHYTHTRGCGYAKTQIGQDGSVPIPDRYLESGQTVYCYIYLHDGATDGETEYEIIIPVKARAVPLNEAVTSEEQGVIQQLMSALTAAANKAEQGAEDAEQSASESATSAGESAASAGESATSAEESAQRAAAAAEQAAIAAAQAQASAESAAQSGASSDASGQQAQAAAASATAAAGSASDAAASEETATQQAQAAAAQAAEALAQAQAALAQAQAAAASAASALAQAQAAAQAKTDAETAAAEAEAEADRVVGLLDTKQDKLTAGDNITIDANNVISAVGGNYTLAYDSTTGRLSLLNDGTEVSYVILSGLPVTITQEGDVLHVNNVPAVTSITQTDDTLALA